jgi:chromosome segregation ATPase
MIRSRIGWVLSLAFILTLWGCAQNDSAPTARANRLQEELQNLASKSDQLRLDLRKAQEEKSRLVAQLEQGRQAQLELAKERDDLRQNLNTRTAERDHVQNQIEQLRKGIHAIMEQLDTMAIPTEQTARGANAN